MYGKHDVGGEGTRLVWYGNFSDCSVHDAGIAPCLEGCCMVTWICIRYHRDLNTINRDVAHPFIISERLAEINHL
jgi:hypothetical protein